MCYNIAYYNIIVQHNMISYDTQPPLTRVADRLHLGYQRHSRVGVACRTFYTPSTLLLHLQCLLRVSRLHLLHSSAVAIAMHTNALAAQAYQIAAQALSR